MLTALLVVEVVEVSQAVAAVVEPCASGATLAQLSATTGISVSTLSRLESGQRRHTLELLLLLARAHQVSLDELVDAPTTGDPRIHPRPISRNGMTFIPLTRRPGGLQAYKQIIPAQSPACEPQRQVHEGYEWLYVLSGRLRLLLGEHDVILTAGEVAEFDTRTRTTHPANLPEPGTGQRNSTAPGTYRLAFGTAAYFTATGQRGVPIPAFTVEKGHYHVSLLLYPFAYLTYRGS